MNICESCEKTVHEDLREYDGELQCSECIHEAIEYEEGMIEDRDRMHNKD